MELLLAGFAPLRAVAVGLMQVDASTSTRGIFGGDGQRTGN